MGLALALDTSTPVGAVGLGEDGTVLCESLLTVRATHSEAVLPEIRRVMKEAGRRIEDLESVVVGAGPGSFTGVRIAASFAKGICFSRSIPLYAYSSLAAIAAGVGGSDPVCATIDARRGQVYAAGYRLSQCFETLFGPEAVTVASIPDLLSEDESWTVVRDGQPRASALLRLASDYPEAGRVMDIARWEPGYVRPSSAELSGHG
jgi:tRNA threonylcarbamoyladenosine biosynthesis protein TsaB